MSMNWTHNELSGEVIGAAIDVHRELGPGLLEKVYEECLCKELTIRDIPFRRQMSIPIMYKGEKLDSSYRCDLWVDDRIIVEVKCVEALHPIHKAQLMGYLKMVDNRLGLLINFNVRFLREGIERVVNKFED